MAATTRYPVVLVHGASRRVHDGRGAMTVSVCLSWSLAGLFGYGKVRPLWNRWAPYWPERELRALNANVLIADVGMVSSDHDRACELFYQLYGGTVDYGEAHARAACASTHSSRTCSWSNHCFASMTSPRALW
jgi:hypothetical protein